jgi:RNA 3'-terminal phosphate cyclase (ATP)
VLQTVLPALMLADAPSRVLLGGGTHNPMAPPFHFLERSFAPLVRRLGVGLDLSLQRHGFYPAGGGAITAGILPVTQRLLAPCDLVERGVAGAFHAECLAPGLPADVATRELAALQRQLGWSDGQVRPSTVRSNEGPGNALMATLEHAHVTELFTSFGEKGVSAERVAKRLADEVAAFLSSRAALGPHLADQWMLPLALAVAGSGVPALFSCSEMTGHSTTNVRTIEAFLPVRFEVEAGEAGGTLVRVVPRDAG